MILYIMAGDQLSLSPPRPPGSALSVATRTSHFLVTSIVRLPVQSCFSVLQFAVAYPPSSSTRLLTSTPTKLRLRYCRSTDEKDVGLATSTNSAAYSEIKLFSVFRLIGFNEKETEALLLANPALRFTPYESIYARLQSLQDLGVKGAVLWRLVSKRPDILTAEEVEAFVCFLLRNDNLNLRGKIEASQIERLLHSTEPRFLLGFEGKVRLLLRHGIPQEKLPLVLNKANLTKAFCLKSVQEIERMLAFLNRFGGVDIILGCPATLNYDLDTKVIPRISFLFNLSGGDEVATATVLRRRPFLLAYTADHLSGHVEFLKSFAGLSDAEIFRIVLIYPNLFTYSRKRRLHPRIDFLKKCGLNSNDIFKFLTYAPAFLSASFEKNLAHKLAFLFKLGYKDGTRELAMAIGPATRTSCRNLQEVIGLFLEYGLSCENILEMSIKQPHVLHYNHESTKEKLEYFVKDMGREIGELLTFPAFLGYNLESRIKYRYEAKKSTIGEGQSFANLFSVSTKKFLEESNKKTAKTVKNVNLGNELTD